MSQQASSTGKFAAFCSEQSTDADRALQRHAESNSRLLACLKRTKSSISGEMPAIGAPPPGVDLREWAAELEKKRSR